MISVIVPVYNTEKFLARCIDSVLAQSYKDFELILVNDGSKDKSGEILDEYKFKDERIRVYHQDNHGASMARKNGLAHAKGEWVTFVDSDDTMPVDALCHYSECLSDETDIVIGWLNQCCYKEDSFTIDEYRRRNIGRCGIIVGPPTHTFRKSIIPQDAFNIPKEITMGEDVLMNIRIAFNTEKPVVITHHYVYNYNIGENQNNATNNFRISMEYEHLYHQYRLKSIPKSFHSYYMKEMVGVRVYDLLRYLNAYPLDRSWRHSPFWEILQNDMKNVEYKTNRANMLLLNSNNLVSQILLIVYKKIRSYFVSKHSV